MKLVIFLMILIVISCKNNNADKTIADDDRKKVLDLHEQYRQNWLANDSAKVVNLFSDDAVIIPPNNKGEFVRGKKAIGGWWFTANGDTTYPITGFDYNYDSLISLEDNFAVLNGVSTVRWVTQIKDSVIANFESSSNYMSVFKKEDGKWKYFRQIWNAKPK